MVAIVSSPSLFHLVKGIGKLILPADFPMGNTGPLSTTVWRLTYSNKTSRWLKDNCR